MSYERSRAQVPTHRGHVLGYFPLTSCYLLIDRGLKFMFFSYGFPAKLSIERFYQRRQHPCKFMFHLIVLGHQYGRRDVMRKHSIDLWSFQ